MENSKIGNVSYGSSFAANWSMRHIQMHLKALCFSLAQISKSILINGSYARKISIQELGDASQVLVGKSIVRSIVFD